MQRVRLKDVCDKIGSGATPRGGESVYISSGIALIRSQNIYNDHFDWGGLAYIGPEHAAELDGVAVQEGDVLLNITGDSVARVNRAPADVIPARVNQHVAIVRPRRDTLDSRYLHYILASPFMQDFLLGLASSGGTRQALTKGMIEELEVDAPCLDDQRTVARVLGALDDQIELNWKMNRTLNEMATALFRSWFVDFDPVVAKAAKRKPTHLRPDLAALFPAHFQASALGEIPQGWEVKSIEQLARYVNGRAFTKGASGTGRMVIRIAELNSGPGGSTVYSDVAAAPENIARPGDLLFAWSGSLDVYRWYRDEAIINQHIFKVICEKYPQWFVHHQLREAMPFFQDIAADKATTMGHIKREHLSQALVILPPNNVLEAADKVFQPIYAKQLANERESLTLAALRDTLLPKLLSGELRVKTAEKLVEAH